MNDLIEFLTSKEIMVVYAVAGIACVICFIIYLIDKSYYKRKQKQNTKELNKLVEEVHGQVQDKKETKQNDLPLLTNIEVKKVETPKVQEVKKVEVPKVQEVKKAETPKVQEVKPVEAPKVQEVKPVEAPKVQEIKKAETPKVQEVKPVEAPKVQEIKKEEIHEVPIMIKPIVPVKEELEYTDIEPNKEEAQKELQRLTEELEKAEQETKNIDLTSYEEEQEENAIISLDELVKKSKEMYESNEVTQYADEGNEPISLEDLERRMNKAKEDIATITADITEDSPEIIKVEDTPELTITPITTEITEDQKQEIEDVRKHFALDDLNTISQRAEQEIEEASKRPKYQGTNKFQNSPVISPIFGIERKETQTEMELENTANYEKLDEEIKKTNEFLMTLRELQKHLD